ncbi:glycosyltransferase family 39 protein [Streptomyces sp. NPDC050704]|uniref:glycosyltransferase family 39 protein n=1 Tax=Streptomyces sp. NPDC050704 TaxID=3157219 RepID=UPI00342C58F3
MVVRRPQLAAAVRVPVLVPVLVPVVVMFGIGLWGIDRGGMWRDEAVTFEVARRSLPQIWHLLHSVDAVHGLYYLLMHPVLAVHPGEVALRLPSLCAAAATAGLVAALGARLARPRVGLWAGLLYAVTPMAGHFAQEGRSYALVAAGAAAATLLLVRAADSGGTLPWCAYGGGLAVTVLLHELAVLLLLAHAAALALARMPRRVWRGWALTAAAVLLVLLPLVLVSSGQAGQVAWLRPPGGGAVERLLRSFAGPTRLVLGPYLLLIALALRAPLARRGEFSLPAVALPLLLLPPATLLAVSRHWPLYDDRYVLYALAGAPLLAAAGAERLLEAASRLRFPAEGLRLPAAEGLHAYAQAQAHVRVHVRHAPTLLGVLAITLAFASQLPVLRADRDPARRPDNLAAVAAAASERLRPGDPVLFLPALGRRSALTYPKGFEGTRDIALQEPAPVSGTLYGRETGPGELRRRLDGLDRVWVVAAPYALTSAWYPRNATERVKLTVVGEEFVPRAEFVRKGSVLRLYVRRPPAGTG